MLAIFPALILWMFITLEKTFHRSNVRAQKPLKTPGGLQAAGAGNASNFPFPFFSFLAFYLTFIDSGASGGMSMFFCFSSHSQSCTDAHFESWVGGLRVLLKGSLPAVVEGCENSVILKLFFQILLFITEFKSVTSRSNSTCVSPESFGTGCWVLQSRFFASVHFVKKTRLRKLACFTPNRFKSEHVQNRNLKVHLYSCVV